MTKQELIDRLEYLYESHFPNVQVSEHLENDGTHVLEAMVRVCVSIRIQEEDISAERLSQARESALNILQQQLK